MKLKRSNRTVLIWLAFFGLLIGTLAWEIIERIIGAAGSEIDLSVGPIGFDLDVISMYVHINPGSLLGVAAAFILFKRL